VSDSDRDSNPPGEDAPAPPAFDKAAARQRYRATMRGPFMRRMNIMLVLIILLAWGFGVAAVFARDVEALPGHDLSVVPSRCVACHAAAAANTPAMPHPAFPSCGFCHRQGPPPR
jgi:hypothetical protein